MRSLTEEQAKKTWCPEARVAVEIDRHITAVNRKYGAEENDKDFLCLASECACWDWEEEQRWSENNSYTSCPSDTKGHCGKINA